MSARPFGGMPRPGIRASVAQVREVERRPRLGDVKSLGESYSKPAQFLQYLDRFDAFGKSLANDRKFALTGRLESTSVYHSR